MKMKSKLLAFNESFDTDTKCLDFLCQLKWGNGFCCYRCKHTTAIKGRTWYYRRCQNCKYDESCTANTLFHKLKIPVKKAFLLVYQLSSSKKGMSCCEIKRQFNVHLKTAWFFKCKTQQAMQDGSIKKFKEYVEHCAAPPENQVQQDVQKEVIVKISLSAQALQKAIITSVNTNSEFDATEKWNKTRWIPIKNESEIKRKSKPRISIKVLFIKSDHLRSTNLYSYNLKTWLGGIHHLVSLAHLQRYLNEFQYKYDRRHLLHSNPEEILRKIVEMPWLPYSMAKAS